MYRPRSLGIYIIPKVLLLTGQVCKQKLPSYVWLLLRASLGAQWKLSFSYSETSAIITGKNSLVCQWGKKSCLPSFQAKGEHNYCQSRYDFPSLCALGTHRNDERIFN